DLDPGRRELESAYRINRGPRRLLAGQARLTDRILRGLWAEIDPPPGCALVAVGGYGRGELFPHSDVDVVVLLPQPLTDARSGGASGIEDRKSTRLNSSHVSISYAVFCLKKKNKEVIHLHIKDNNRGMRKRNYSRSFTGI